MRCHGRVGRAVGREAGRIGGTADTAEARVNSLLAAAANNAFGAGGLRGQGAAGRGPERRYFDPLLVALILCPAGGVADKLP